MVQPWRNPAPQLRAARSKEEQAAARGFFFMRSKEEPRQNRGGFFL
tara:strand:+ start:808 stop:945 length:138 start_codon:yes stop_codon:yes gene_type:complete